MATSVTEPTTGSTQQRRTGRSSGARRSGKATQTDTAGTAFNRLAATCLVLFALVWLVPFLWAFITSIRPDNEISAHPTRIWSSHFNLHAYASAWNSSPIGWWYINSFIISTLAVIFTVIVCSMAAFALVNLRFRGKYALFGIILAGLMLPTEALVLPQFMEFRAFHLLGTYWAIVLPAVALPVSVFVFHAFIKGIPVALIEAARIDGASWFRIYYQVVMPLCRPAISAVAILTFVTSWNAFLWPLLVLTQTKSQTIPVGLSGLIGGAAIQYAETMASAVLGILPLLAVFLLLQRQITQGVANTGIK
jgi:multiple sugar transport system permease protein